MKVKDLLQVIGDNIIVNIFTTKGYCGSYVKQDKYTCYFNDWYIKSITTDSCYSEPTIEIEIQEEKIEDED